MNMISNSRRFIIQAALCAAFLFSFFVNRVAADVVVDTNDGANFFGANTLTTPTNYAATWIGNKLTDTNVSNNNSLLLTGSNAQLQNTHELYVGQVGNSNTLTINTGASARSATVLVGDHYASNNSLYVTGIGSSLTGSNSIQVGGNSSTGNYLEAASGAVVTSSNVSIGHGIYSSNNAIVVKGTGSQLNVSQTLAVGELGNDNSLTIQEGASAHAATTIIGSNATATGNSIRVTGSGSSFTTTDGFTIGYLGYGTLTLDSGASVTAGQITMAQNTGSKGTIDIGRVGHSDTGGTLNASTITFGNGTGKIRFNQSDEFNLNTALVGGSNVTVRQDGSGNSILSQSNSYGGITEINAGTLTLSGPATLGKMTNRTTIGNGTLDLGGTTQTQSLVSMTGGGTAQNGAFIDTTVTLSGNSNNIGASLQGTSSVMNQSGNNTLSGINDTYTGGTVVNGGTLTKVGLMTLHSSGGGLTVAAGAGMNVQGDLTSDAPSTVTYYADGNTANPRINVTGDANFSQDTLILHLGSLASAPASSLWGTKIAIASGETVEKFLGVSLADDSSLRLSQSCVGDPVLYGVLAPTNYAQAALNQNQTNVAIALNSFTNATSGDAQVVSTALDALTADQYPIAFQQISPALYSSFSTIAFNNANAQNNQLIQRLGNIRIAAVGFDSMGLNESPILNDNKASRAGEKNILIPSVDNHWGVFTDANGIFANVNINNQLPGYSAESGGITIGADYKWNDSFSTGLYTGYEGTQSKQSGGNFICDNGSRFGVFGTYQVGGVFANAIVGGDTHSYQVQRSIQFPGINRTATSAPTAQELDSMLATGYDMKRGNFTFGPITSLQYTYLGVQPFTETGAQSLNLAVESENANSLIYSLGSHAFYTWQANRDILVVPQINLAWQHEFLQNPYAINSTLQGGGGVFNYTTTAPLRDSLYTGVGFTIRFFKKYDASFFYNASAANPDLVSQNFFASWGMNF